MYLVVVAFLALILTVSRPPFSFVSDWREVLAAVTAATILPAIAGAVVSWRALRLLDRHPDRPSRGQAVFGEGLLACQIAIGLLHATVLLCTDWLILCEQIPVIGRWPIVGSLAALTPFLLSIVLLWLTSFPADRAVRQIALEVYLVRGRPIRPVWSLGEYLLYNFRHQVLFVLVPMLLILITSELVTYYARAIRRLTCLAFAPDLLIGGSAVLVAVLAPELLRHIWVTQRLPDGPLRDRLLRLAKKLRLRCRDVLVWRSGGMIVNAAVMGVIAPLRYVLITDAMLEQMDETKIEAVFGHEAGHVKRHHILYFLMFAFTSGCIATIASIHIGAAPGTDAYNQRLVIVGGLLLLKWVLLFGWISRRFERQADVSGVQALVVAGVPCVQPCRVHGLSAGVEAHGNTAICTTAAHIFGDALYEVALLNGIRPEARSWRHSSIASRSNFVQRLAHNPPLLARFERTVRRVKAGIFVAALFLGLWASYEMQIFDALGIGK